MINAKSLPWVVNGWTIFAHSLFLDQMEALTRQVEFQKQKDPLGYLKKNTSKRLAAIVKLTFEMIPQDPVRFGHDQGNTLGEGYEHWSHTKFFQQCRLFYRYHIPSSVIVYVWINDEDTRRSYESDDDIYRVFRKMLEDGHSFD